MKLMEYKYIFEPEMYKYILGTNILNRRKDEHKIFKKLVKGYTCEQISKMCHYSIRTIHNRRKDIYLKTRKYMT